VPREIKARFAGKLALNSVVLGPDTIALWGHGTVT